MRTLAFGLIAGAGVAVGSLPASREPRTTRIEPRPFYGAIVTREAGVRVFRPLPPHDRIIINPGQRHADQARRRHRLPPLLSSTAIAVRRRRPLAALSGASPRPAPRPCFRCKPGSGLAMPRYRVTLEYDGTPFVGWQVQALGVSVQGRLTEAIGKFSGETVSLRGAGRTDAGVHALGQVAHFDLARAWPADTVRAAVNFHLKPDPIAILDCADRRRRFRRPLQRHGAPLPLSHPGAAGPAGAGPRPGVVGAAADAHGGDARGGPGAGRPARLHHLSRRRLPGQVAGQDARPPGGHGQRRGDPHRRLGPLVPAQPGALDGGLAEAGRRGQMERRRSRAPRSRPATAPPAAPSLRRAASISCASTMRRSRRTAPSNGGEARS